MFDCMVLVSCRVCRISFTPQRMYLFVPIQPLLLLLSLPSTINYSWPCWHTEALAQFSTPRLIHHHGSSRWKMPKKRWSNEKGQLTFCELQSYPLAPHLETINNPEKRPQRSSDAQLPWSSWRWCGRIISGHRGCSSKCPNSEIFPPSPCVV